VSCPHRIIAENFTAATSLNGPYSVMDDDWANERVVYRHELNSQACIWWHKQYRHWWVGDCRKKGLNHGYAWIEPDIDCPTDLSDDGHPPLWRRSGTDEPLPLVGVRRSSLLSIPVLQFGTPEEEKGFASRLFFAHFLLFHSRLFFCVGTPLFYLTSCHRFFDNFLCTKHGQIHSFLLWLAASKFVFYFFRHLFFMFRSWMFGLLSLRFYGHFSLLDVTSFIGTASIFVSQLVELLFTFVRTY